MGTTVQQRRHRSRVVAAVATFLVGSVLAGQPAGARDVTCPEPGTGRVVHCYHDVRRGESLWSIARDNLRQDFGMRRPAGRDVRTRSGELHALNRDAIGSDPGRLRVGTALKMYPWVGGPGVPPPPPPRTPEGSPALDATFGGGDGLGTNGRPDRYADARAVALDAEGRIVTAGQLGPSFLVSRFTPDGAPDTSFGDGGLVTTRIGEYARASAVAVQPDGRVLAAGFATMRPGDVHSDMALVRYLPTGALDPTFGTGGIVGTAFAGYAAAAALAVQPDGRIVVVGSTSDEGGRVEPDVVLVRHLPDGALDPTFGNGGRVVVDHRGGTDIARGVALQPDGRIVVAGLAAPAPTSGASDGLVARFLPDGSLDASFGGTGTVLADPGSPFDTFAAVGLAPDGTIVAAGSMVRDQITPEIVVGRFGRDGHLIGLTTTAAGDGGDAAAVAVGDDGRIVVAGQLGGRAALFRYRSDGDHERTERTDFGGDRSAAFGVVLDAAGRPVVAGCTCDGGSTSTRGGFELPSSVVVARYRR